MIQIRKDEWVNPEAIESMYISNEGLQLFMVSGRVIQLIDDVSRIMKEIEDWFDQDIKKIEKVEVKPKRKYTKKVKKIDTQNEDEDEGQ